MRNGRGRTRARIEPTQIRRISTPKLISRRLLPFPGVRLPSYYPSQILWMTSVRSWLHWMWCRLTRFALTRMHLRLQVRGRHEPELLRPKLLRRKLLRLPAEGEEEGDRAAKARNALHRRASQTRQATSPTKAGRKRREQAVACIIARGLYMMGKFCSHSASSSGFSSEA